MATEDKVTEEKAVTPVRNPEVSKMPPREKMVSTAVHFLTNRKVMQEGSAYQKKAFLQSKGLTDEEINLAFERANIENPPARNSAYFPVAERPAYLEPAPSLWMRINHIGSSVIIIAVACYGIHRIYKLYIEPWLFGEQHKEDRLTEMEHQLVELNRSLSHLRRSVGTIEDTLASQKAQLNKLCEEAIPSSEVLQNPLIFSDIKSEVASIKSLLLGRQRFPPAPNVSPMIPSWQLESTPEKKNEEENSSEKKNEEENSPEKKNESDPKEMQENMTAGSCSENSDDLKNDTTLSKESNQNPECEGSLIEGPLSNGFQENSMPEECSKPPVHEVMNSSVNGETEESAANEVEA